MEDPKPATYKVRFTKSAQKDYEGIADLKLKRGVNKIIDKLKEDPYQFKKLSGPLSLLRAAKTFSFRVLYQIQDNQLIVLVISVEHRREVYR